MANEGNLSKLLIEAYTEPDYPEGGAVDSYQVLFNPETYSQKYEVQYDDVQGSGDTSSPLAYRSIKPQEYTFDFFFDGTGASGPRVEVSDEIEKFLKVAGKHDGSIHRPRYLKITWGTLLSKCVLKTADINYTLFRPDGSPLRAKVKGSFTENVEDTLRVAEERENSPDLTHVRVVHAGDTLPLMCHRIYGDSAYYLQIAEYNQLKNFRDLKVGQELYFPPLIQQRP